MGNSSNRIYYLLAVTTALRLVIASLLEFGNDEVYYFLYALHLQSNYFDHPGGVALLERLTTLNLLVDSEVMVRLGPILCAALGTWMVYRLGTAMRDEQTGWLAALLYTASIYASLIAGNFIIPDSPQVVCWLGAVWVFYRMASSGGHASVGQWLLFGLLSGLAVMCKVHGIFLWVGAGLYTLLYRRAWLTGAGPYAGALLSTIVFSPILLWNIDNDFITYRFHSGRVSETSIHPDYFIQSVVGQWAYHNPIVVVWLVGAVWMSRTTSFMEKVAMRVLMVMGLPIIAVVLVMSLFNSMLPHWTGPGFTTLLVLTAAFLQYRMEQKGKQSMPASVRAALILIGAAVCAALVLINFYPGTIGSQSEQKRGDGDFTLDLQGWRSFGKDFIPWVHAQQEQGLIQKDIPIVSHKWFPAAHIEYYVARPSGMTVLGVGNLEDLHHYYWLNKYRTPLAAGSSALCIVPSNYWVPMEEAYGPYFERVMELKSFESRRGGEIVRYFRVYLLEGYRANDEVHQLP